MPTIFTHPVIAVGLSPWFKQIRDSRLLLFTGIVLTVLPDADVIMFRFGIPYNHLFGHRGFTHSIFFALIISGLITWFFVHRHQLKWVPVWLFLFLCTMSHGLLDMLTNGGKGVALFSPFSNERFFFDFQPIEVSTLSIRRFLDGQGVKVILTELKWIWLPCLFVFVFGWLLARAKRASQDSQ
ncbi:MAG: metal-dependent hydrolase [Gammaproteobacteria bacterium]|nr:metal-dependent hydrolase [Gammaproteobacteria bacterium]